MKQTNVVIVVALIAVGVMKHLQWKRRQQFEELREMLDMVARRPANQFINSQITMAQPPEPEPKGADMAQPSEPERKEAARQKTKVHDAIMEYVDRLRPLVREQYHGQYDALWQGILALGEVRMLVYDKGKQQDTTFNRNLVAQLIHQMGSRVYRAGVSDQQMAELLEPGKGKNHSVRQKLGESPNGVVKKAVEVFLAERLLDRES